MSEDIKNKLNFDELKKRYRTVEEENDLLQEKLHKAQKSIKRLRLERTLLLDRIDKGCENINHHNNGCTSDSDTGSDLLLHNDLFDKHHHNNNKPIKHQLNNTTTIIKPPKKKKDPNAPKGPGNVFFLFCRLQRDKIKDENPEENIGDVTKLLGLKWKALPKEEKQVYYDTFKKEMEEYEEAMKTYKSQGGGVDIIDQSQSMDPSAIAESPSLTSSPNMITSPDMHHHYLQPTNLLDDEEEEANEINHGHLSNNTIDNSWKEPITHP